MDNQRKRKIGPEQWRNTKIKNRPLKYNRRTHYNNYTHRLKLI